MKRLKLKYGDHIVAAYAEPASGPGWANSPLWLVVCSEDRGLRLECMQPDEQTAGIASIYRIGAEVHSEMTAAARLAVSIPKRRPLHD